ncbi:hypothetical protein TNCT_340101 [Trichonephila clavata]|uniref:Uncharacterized protein n=1 Tax=Trichonephila clavata TaxID=2740835 RepID=A0A8X6L0Y8_TRICU|nr:hypothetical protein TNCT_340101 [Trichonephila clavata]
MRDDFGEFAAFLKEFRNRLNALPIPEVLTVQDFRRHFHDLDTLCNVLCPSEESGKLRSLPFLCAVEPFKSEDLVLHKMAERGHGAYIRGIWTECMKPICTKGDRGLVLWGSQDLEQWVTLGHTALQLCTVLLFQIRVWRA